MRSKYVRSIIVLGMLFLIVGVGVAVKGGMAQANTLVALNAQVDPVIAQSQFVQSTPASQTLAISVGLQVQNAGELDSLLQAVSDPASPSYHQYLTPDQFTQEFAPTPDQVQQVESYLQGMGITVTNVAPDNLLLDAKATVAQAQQAFSVQINTYKQGKETYYANNAPVKVPARIRSLVEAVTGLDSHIKFHHNAQETKLTPRANPIGYTPQNIASAYDIAPLQNAGFLGDKQTIALYELDGYQPLDIVNYMQYFNPGLSALTAVANLKNMPVDGYNLGVDANSVEATMDIEMIDAIAPHANVLVYEGPNGGQGINDTYSRIVNDDKAQIVSTSWGSCEAGYSGSGEPNVLDNFFKQGALEGMSFFAASGDRGAYDCGDTNVTVDSPASDPYVTGVGGTTLQLNTNGTIQSETAWSDTSTGNGFNPVYGNGSGGGLSTYFTLPSWQKGSGVQNSYSNGMREVPDVSANADSNSGYAIYCTVLLSSLCSATGWQLIAGTSAAAPLWAASTALINQYMVAQGKKALGQMNPVLYGLYNGTRTYPAFHDITSGNNLLYNATPGYDLATGLGSPDVYNIARDLVINGV